ncbi:MAG: EamA family transporter [Solirubrobacteraceae bacterium]
MIALLGGLGAAFAWATSSLSSARSSRLADPLAVVAGMMVVGLPICAPVAAAQGVPTRLHGVAWLWLALAGGGNVSGLLLTYAAYRRGLVALVTALVSTEGAVAAVIAVIAGERLSSEALAALALAVLGVSVASIRPQTGVMAATTAGVQLERDRHRRSVHLLVVGLALTAALLFGVSLYATARAGALLPTVWVVLAARLVGSGTLALPLAVTGRLRLSWRAFPFVVTSGICEVLGFFAYTLGSRHGIAIAAVIASQFSTVVVIGSYVLFGERLGRMQLAGVCAVIVGVSLVAVATS